MGDAGNCHIVKSEHASYPFHVRSWYLSYSAYSAFPKFEARKHELKIYISISPYNYLAFPLASGDCSTNRF